MEGKLEIILSMPFKMMIKSCFWERICQVQVWSVLWHRNRKKINTLPAFILPSVPRNYWALSRCHSIMDPMPELLSTQILIYWIWTGHTLRSWYVTVDSASNRHEPCHSFGDANEFSRVQVWPRHFSQPVEYIRPPCPWGCGRVG